MGSSPRRPMYNGIGLQSVRGSATNGYVQRNLSFVRRNNQRPSEFDQEDYEPPAPKRADPGILEHERKRQIELKIVMFRDAMEERNYSEEEIEVKVAEIRKQLAAAGDENKEESTAKSSYAIAEAQAKKNRAFEAAMGISKDYEVGQAFDQDLQDERKQERMEQRERDQELKEREQRKRDKEADQRKKIRAKEREQDDQLAADRANRPPNERRFNERDSRGADESRGERDRPDRRDAGRRSPARRSPARKSPAGRGRDAGRGRARSRSRSNRRSRSRRSRSHSSSGSSSSGSSSGSSSDSSDDDEKRKKTR